MYSFSKDDNNIYSITLEGVFEIDDIIKVVEEFRTQTTIPEEAYFLYDLQNAKLNLQESALQKLHKYTTFSTAQFTRVRTAIVVQKPELTAYSMLFSVNQPKEHIKRQVFSTLKGAKEWLIDNQYDE